MRAFGFFLIAAALYAQPTRRHTPAERYELFKKNLAQRAAAITGDQFKGIDNLEAWKRRRPEVRRQLLDMLGLDPLPPRTRLNARITGKFEREGYRVENIVFESRPKLYVTGNLYLPTARTMVPPIVYVTGHSPNPAGAKVEYQHHGIWFAKNGFAAFVLDTIEFGEIPGIHHGIHDLGMYHWLSLGYGPAGVETWNAIRALDYLETRPELDLARAGITGRSGGGAITWFTAAVDERFKAAAPVHGSWSVGPHVAGDSVKENCDCIYFWNTYQLDLPIVGALIAPRPLRIVNATKDDSFPPAGYEPVYQCLRPVYQWYGAPEKLSEFAEVTGHVDTPPYRKAADEWLNQWLRNDRTPFDESGIVKESDVSLLTVLKPPPADAVNEGIDRTFIAVPKLREWKTMGEWTKRRQELTTALRDKVFGAAPKTKVPFQAWKAPYGMWTNKYTDSFQVEFDTEENVRVHGQLFVPRDGKPTHPALIYVKGSQDVVYPVDYDIVLSALTTHVVLILNPRAVDYPMDNYRMANTKMAIALLGGTLESLQVWDIQRSVDYLLDQEKLALSGISVYGRKQIGALALHAAALDNRITRVILEDAPASHWQGPPLLNVLRLTDLPEVAGLVAPREIVSLTPLPEAYRYTSSVYRLHGKSIRQAGALGSALRVRD